MAQGNRYDVAVIGAGRNGLTTAPSRPPSPPTTTASARSGTSAMWSPTCKRNIAIATVDAGCAGLGTRIEADTWFRKELRIGKPMTPRRVVKRPFRDKPRKRA